MRTIALITASLLLASSLSHAAEAPLPDEKLVAQATHIVRGKVLEVTTKVEKSKLETSRGVHKDTIYTNTVEVDVISKGGVEKEMERSPSWPVSRTHASRTLLAYKATSPFRRKVKPRRST